jgi:SAM-dependent methyltransferase
MTGDEKMTSDEKAIELGHPSYVWRFGQDRRLELIYRYAPLDGKRILDVGCGLGMYVRKMRRFSDDVYGVDIDPDKVAKASKELPNIQVAPAEKLPFADDSLDVILSHEVIEHVDDDAQAIREAYRCLRPGGRLVVFAPNRLYFFETHGVYIGKRYVFGNIPLVNWLPGPLRNRFAPHVRAYRSGDIRRLFAALPGRFIVFTQIYPGYDNLSARRPALGRVLRGITYTLESTPLKAFGLSHFAVFEKQTGNS